MKNFLSILVVVGLVSITPFASGTMTVSRSVDNCKVVKVADVTDSQWQFLGCTVDEQQCRSRANNRGYRLYKAERSYYCANVAKFGCWGTN